MLHVFGVQVVVLIQSPRSSWPLTSPEPLPCLTGKRATWMRKHRTFLSKLGTRDQVPHAWPQVKNPAVHMKHRAPKHPSTDFARAQSPGFAPKPKPKSRRSRRAMSLERTERQPVHSKSEDATPSPRTGDPCRLMQLLVDVGPSFAL